MTINFVATTTTNADGEYYFEVNCSEYATASVDYTPNCLSTYTISEEQKAGWSVADDSEASYTEDFDGHSPLLVDFYNYQDIDECGDGIVNQDSEECDGDDGVTEGYYCSDSCILVEKHKSYGGGSHIYLGGKKTTAEEPAEEDEEVLVLGEEGYPLLNLSKTVSQEYANAGDTGIEYTLTIENNGNITAFEVSISDTLPEGLSFADFDGLSRTWQVGDIEPFTSQEIKYTVNVSDDVEAKVYTNIAIASALNNDDVEARADLEVTKIEVLGAELVATGFNLSEFLALFLSGLLLFGLTLNLRESKENA